VDKDDLQAYLEFLVNERVFVRVCYGGDPIYLVGTLLWQKGRYVLMHDLGESARFEVKDVSYIEVVRSIIELREGAGEYWPIIVRG
jgi:hypothetical protein